MNRTLFATLEGRPVTQYTLTAGKLTCEILDFGGIIRSLRVPDRQGRPVDVVLGFDTLQQYLDHTCYFGAMIGPFANRIGGASFPLGGGLVTLPANEGANSLHSGPRGFDRRLFTPVAQTEDTLRLAIDWPDGDSGFPGPIHAEITYLLTPAGLELRYEARSARDTVVNLTNHSYFNLSGHDAGPVTDQWICLAADHFTPTDAHSIPTGELRPVEGTPMDLRRPLPIGQRIDEDDLQLRQAGGYDHNWAADGAGTLRPIARAGSPRTGITLTCLTDQPGVQFYSGNYVPQGLAGKDGAVYGRRHGFCLETQTYPDAPNHPDFPSALLRAGETYRRTTSYRFAAE